MAKFTNENKEVKEFNDNYFAYGVHKVKIVSLDLGNTEDDGTGKEYVEIEVVGEAGQEDTVRVWFTTDAAINYSFNVLRQIFVHNAPEDKKDAARAAFDKVADTTELVELLGSKLAGGKGECWYTKYQSKDRTYTNKDGVTLKSVEKNVYGYQPKLKSELVPEGGAVDLGALGVTTPNTKDEPFPDSAASTIPSDDDWS